MPKRARGSSGSSAQQRARWASSKFNNLYPYSQWGAARILRGTPHSLEEFGPSYKEATPYQKNRRKIAGFTGRGR
jgi:hypothetical protein